MTTTMAHRLLKGTLLLTITGFITRVLGFFYRIYLADLLGAHYLGIYQLIFPVYAICFTIYGAGIQTALSQVIASRKNDRENPSGCLRLFVIGTVIAMALALLLQFLLSSNAEWVAIHFVMEVSLTPYLRIMTVFFPVLLPVCLYQRLLLRYPGCKDSCYDAGDRTDLPDRFCVWHFLSFDSGSDPAGKLPDRRMGACGR